MPTVKVLKGDALAMLKTLPASSVRCCITSPPFWRKRDYPVPDVDWPGGKFCFMPGLPSVYVKQWRGQLGWEESPLAFCAHLVQIFREVRRVLKRNGTLWVNMGESYSTNAGGAQGKTGQRADRRFTQRIPTKRVPGVPLKSAIGIPARVAFALQADGWRYRQEIIWSKPNPNPESVTDRCVQSHEQLYLFTKSKSYLWNADAVAEPLAPDSLARYQRAVSTGEAFDPARHKPGNLVLDPFGGTATTAALAMAHGRNAVVCEAGEAYWQMIERRLANVQPAFPIDLGHATDDGPLLELPPQRERFYRPSLPPMEDIELL